MPHRSCQPRESASPVLRIRRYRRCLPDPEAVMLWMPLRLNFALVRIFSCQTRLVGLSIAPFEKPALPCTSRSTFRSGSILSFPLTRLSWRNFGVRQVAPRCLGLDFDQVVGSADVYCRRNGTMDPSGLSGLSDSRDCECLKHTCLALPRQNDCPVDPNGHASSQH